MRWILSFCMPPLAVLACGRPYHAALNLILCLCGYFPGVLHAIVITADTKTKESVERYEEAKRREREYATRPYHDPYYYPPRY